MKITTRQTKDFIEVTVDEKDVTIWHDSNKEINDMIENLLIVTRDLCGYTGKTIDYHIDRVL